MHAEAVEVLHTFERSGLEVPFDALVQLAVSYAGLGQTDALRDAADRACWHARIAAGSADLAVAAVIRALGRAGASTEAALVRAIPS